MRIAFCGTPDFAAPSLQMLIGEGHELAVFTNPDRPKGRSGEPCPPPVKVLAEKHGIPVYQFERIRSPEGVEALRAFAPDLMITAAFGQILSCENLDIPCHGCFNVHGSLLPKYRGAAPIQWAIINGEPVTGVTIMLTEEGLDTGDILLEEETPIGEDETAGEVFDRLADMGASLLHEAIEALEKGTLTRRPQDHERATKCGVIKKEDAKIDFSRDAVSIHNLVRGMNPWPIAFSTLDGEPVKVYCSKKSAIDLPGKPGECLIADDKHGLFVKTGDGMIEILELQFPGAKRMDSRTLLRGKKLLGKVFA